MPTIFISESDGSTKEEHLWNYIFNLEHVYNVLKGNEKAYFKWKEETLNYIETKKKEGDNK